MDERFRFELFHQPLLKYIFLNLETWVNVDHNEGEDDAHFSTNEWSQAVIDATLRFEDNHPLIN